MGDREQIIIIKKPTQTQNQSKQKKVTWKIVKTFSRIRDNITPMEKKIRCYLRRKKTKINF